MSFPNTTEFPYSQSSGVAPNRPGTLNYPKVWEIESFPVSESSLETDNDNIMWHAVALASPGLGFCWAFPRIGFNFLSYAASWEQSLGAPGNMTIYGINADWASDTIIADFPKGLTGTGFMEAWKHDVLLDVSSYAGIGIIMDPAWNAPHVDGTHAVKQTNSYFGNGTNPQNMSGMVPKTSGVTIPSITAVLPTIAGAQNLMTHWMKVGVR